MSLKKSGFLSPLRTELIKPSNLAHAAELLRVGKLVAFPTDTFFALGAVLQDTAVEALFEAKGRMRGNPVPVLLSSADQVSQVTGFALEGAPAALTKAFWPGPMTLVLPASTSVPASVTAGTGGIGVRVPDHDLARELIAQVGSPVTGTSANLSGSEPCKTAGEVMSQLSGIVDAVVDAACGTHSEPSTVVSINNGDVRIVREGSIPETEIRRTVRLL